MTVVTVARKPLSAPTVASNTLEVGAGGLNVDGSRIACEGGSPSADRRVGYARQVQEGGPTGTQVLVSGWRSPSMESRAIPKASDSLGRWPANLVLSESGAEDMDEQSGQSTSDGHTYREGQRPRTGSTDFRLGERTGQAGLADSGGSSRFFKKVGTPTK